MKYKYTKEELENAVKLSDGLSSLCKKLDIKSCGGNYKTLKNKINFWGVDISHFVGQSWNTGERFINNNKKFDLSDVLIESSNYNRFHLKKRLVSEGLLEYKCIKCGNEGEWLGEPISLQLDHINGVNDDNRLGNLRFLCPNCHSQTSTYAGKRNKK